MNSNQDSQSELTRVKAFHFQAGCGLKETFLVQPTAILIWVALLSLES